jgi:hypothetical protein
MKLGPRRRRSQSASARGGKEVSGDAADGKGAPHAMCATLKDKVNEELLAFIKAA